MQIEYDDKQPAVDPANPEPNEQGRAEDWNEVKQVVNVNDTQLDGLKPILPIKTYMSWLTQTGTNAPTAENVKNGLGFDPLLAYGNTGFIIIGLTGLVDHSKIAVDIAQKRQASKDCRFSYLLNDSGGNTRIFVYGYNQSNSALENDLLVKTPIKIEIYA